MVGFFCAAGGGGGTYLVSSGTVSYTHLEIEFVITEFNPKRRRVIGDRKQLIVARKAEMQKALFERIAVGQKVEGTVKNVTDFGAFIDLGGADGLLHISEMSWGDVYKRQTGTSFAGNSRFKEFLNRLFFASSKSRRIRASSCSGVSAGFKSMTRSRGRFLMIFAAKLLALKITGPLTPKWVNSISPNSFQMCIRDRIFYSNTEKVRSIWI